MPTTSPPASTSGPPELPTLMAASVWMSPLRVPSGELIVRSTAETIPVVTDGRPPRLRALPMAITGSPTSRSADVPSVAGCSGAAPSTLMTARSLSDALPTSEASCCEPSNRRTEMSSDSATTWALVSTRPSSDRTTPVPAPSNTLPCA